MIQKIRQYNVTGIVLGIAGVSLFGYSVFMADKIVMLMAIVLLFWADVTGPLVEDFIIKEEMND